MLSVVCHCVLKHCAIPFSCHLTSCQSNADLMLCVECSFLFSISQTLCRIDQRILLSLKVFKQEAFYLHGNFFDRHTAI